MPSSAYFLITGGFLLLLGIALSIKFKLFRLIFINLFVSFSILEALLALALAFPTLLKFGGPKTLLHNIYMGYQRNIVQFEPRFARYDAFLNYTLKPGVFFFRNAEYCNEFRVNRLGLRDSETALEAPEIIVVGDSVPMGWGVNQNETYAKLVEKESGFKTLNAAISSFSTVQAMRILDRIDSSKLKYLIIYYECCKAQVNRSFDEGTFQSMDPPSYEKTVSDYLRKKKYYPGKFVRAALKNLAERRRAKPDNPFSKSYSKDAQSLLNVILHAGQTDLTRVKIIILCEKEMTEPLKREIRLGKYPDFLKNTEVVKQPEIQGPCAYLLDDHPTALWHRQAANMILPLLKPFTRGRVEVKPGD
jgi:hypothetical protein